jgi:hypothetical protein
VPTRARLAGSERWAALPSLVGINRVSGLRPGARTLLVHPSQKIALAEPRQREPALHVPFRAVNEDPVEHMVLSL